MARRFEKMIPIPTRSERVIWWVRHFCIVPDGPNRGQPPVLSLRQEMQVHRVYDGGEPEAVAGPLAAYLALLRGPEWRAYRPVLEAADPWTVWRCASEGPCCAGIASGSSARSWATTYPARAA